MSSECNNKSVAETTEGSTTAGTTAGAPVNGHSTSSDHMFADNSLVWVRLGQSWWPGSVVALDRCPQDFVRDLKKTPLAVIKFFEENG